jgi:5-methylthioribose kinase
MMETGNIEQPQWTLDFLRSGKWIGAREVPEILPLTGGVSNRTVLVRRTEGPDLVLKQALARLRVAVEWLSDPSRNHREALGLKWLGRLMPDGAVPRFLFEDSEHHLFAMEAVGEPHANWKTLLLAGSFDPALAGQCGSLLATIHSRARSLETTLEPVFRDQSFFHSLRLEPYYLFAAERNPDAAAFTRELMEESGSVRETLVHGDYSPKNILVRQGHLVLLDHEVIHWGDPAFDLGFSLTHWVGKANYLRDDQFLNAARIQWAAYCEGTPEVERSPGFQSRVVRHTLACMLARVDGRSPLEYLSSVGRTWQRGVTLELMRCPPENPEGLLDELVRALVRNAS